ncbi:hypothetical protein LguiA_005102 [Lonicera macranthoides]
MPYRKENLLKAMAMKDEALDTLLENYFFPLLFVYLFSLLNILILSSLWALNKRDYGSI